MESALRWIGIYLLDLLAATLGVVLASGILLNLVLKPVEPLIGHSRLFSVAKGPYYPLPILLALVAGYIGNVRFKGNHRLWVWVLPALYLTIRMLLWKKPSVLDSSGWAEAITHFFGGEPPYYPEQDVTVPLYTSIAYSLGAVLEKSGLLRRKNSGEVASGAGDQQE
jgi:hypothetical protein